MNESFRKFRCINSIWIPACQTGSAMLFALVLSIIGGLVMGSLMMTSRLSTKKSAYRREKVSALNIAEAGKERFLAKILHEDFTAQPNSDELIYDEISLGRGTYTVRCITGASTDTLTIHAKGEEAGNITEIEVMALKQPSVPISSMSAKLPGAITARSFVELTGNIFVDGRDHDSLNNLVGPGTYGIHTSTTINVKSNAAELGGNGVTPVKGKSLSSVRSTVAKENAPVSSTMNSPEAFLGLAPGALDAYKISASEFSVPFEGLVYVTESIGPVHFGDSRGILIVHNDTKTTQLKMNQGTFKGLIICDEVDKITGKAYITGAIVTLSETVTSKLGTGNADVLYSQQVLDNLDVYCKNITWEVRELSWKEL